MAFRFAALLALVVLAAVLDVRDRRIPNALTVSGVVLGLALAALEGRPGAAALGIGAALAVGFPFFALGTIGAGDAKLLAALGALVGPIGLVSVALYGAAAGGVMALVGAVRRRTILPVLGRSLDLLVHWLTFGRRGERWTLESPGAVAIPYGVALGAGALVAWFFPLFPGGLS